MSMNSAAQPERSVGVRSQRKKENLADLIGCIAGCLFVVWVPTLALLFYYAWP